MLRIKDGLIYVACKSKRKHINLVYPIKIQMSSNVRLRIYKCVYNNYL